ncbi:16S rRNA (cytosine(1402)-N(4))-methyltransferase RsmH [Candidatus Comchoanobacter bicostacola]|uniref:Ribosomal RNA small subunit methyltransferase H n=1 Tax=Candidatus Comchoanobacter bicostacola TaxID=2919598 RepID=A0ABY5DIQ8_9GAMM|nr:16S rRNA (cytosine(1402)-N(4))-methyltransferase RsmH [Candidatus Comchoanobacter bicostacola]UTC24246.1 16S rRNA (cytosine(1402)-N(4))-methyltransferase RsmH [Candidatus Comchoanobacter bicostacola]
MHIPVMLKNCIDGLAINPAGIYIDATYGRGGHSQAILDSLGPKGSLICFDQDVEAVAHAKTRFLSDERVMVIHASFMKMHSTLSGLGLLGKVDGVLMDIGVSSPQLDEANRGFSFMRDGALDMRMNQTQVLTAYEYLMSVSQTELADTIYTLGDERSSRRIARAIIDARKNKQLLNSTLCLANIIEQELGKRVGKKHPATKTFQAIRMVVNNELGVLTEALAQIPEILSVGGRLVVISFHGLEHIAVKDFIKKYRKKDAQYGFKLLSKEQPSQLEVKSNIRSRSAYTRIMEKCR